MTPNLDRNLKFNPNFVKEIDTAFTKRSKVNTYTGRDSNYETKLEFFQTFNWKAPQASNSTFLRTSNCKLDSEKSKSHNPLITN